MKSFYRFSIFFNHFFPTASSRSIPDQNDAPAQSLPTKDFASRGFTTDGVNSETIVYHVLKAGLEFASNVAVSDDSKEISRLWSKHVTLVVDLAKSLMAAKTERVCVLGDMYVVSRSLVESSQCAGVIPCVVYTKNQSALDLSFAIQSSEASLLVVSSLDSWNSVSPRVQDLNRVNRVVFGPGVGTDGSGSVPESTRKMEMMSWNDFLALGQGVSDAECMAKIKSVKPSDPASLCFSAGSEAPPSAYLLSHSMMLNCAKALQSRLCLGQNDRMLSHLSSANAQQQCLEFIVPCLSGCEVIFGEDDFHRLCHTVSPTVAAGTPENWHSFNQAIVAEHPSKEIEQLSASEKSIILDRVGLSKCRHALCVWGPISSLACAYFNTLGVNLCRVYGCVEACGIISLESVGNQSKTEGFVGKPLDCVNVEIGASNEVIVSGPSVYGGKQDTGDIGKLDGAGNLIIHGRCSDPFVLKTGATVMTQDAECALKNHAFISHAVVIGADQSFPVAFLTLDKDVLEPLAKSRNTTVAQMAQSPQVGASIKSHVDRINAGRDRDVRIRKFVIVPSFDQGKGELTPTGFVRREEVVRNNSRAADALFSPDTKADLQRLQACSSKGDSVLLYSGGTGKEYASLNELEEGLTYWTEEGNDVVRNGRSVTLAGQNTVTIAPDTATVDADELAIVNMLYADGPKVSFTNESNQEVRISQANDFPLGQTLYTSNGTKVIRSETDQLLIQDVRNLPLDLTAAKEEPPQVAPGTPGQRRLRDIRKTKDEEAALKREKDELLRKERERLEQEEKEAQRLLDEEKERLEMEQRALEEEERRLQEEKSAEQQKEIVDADELRIVNMLYDNGEAIELYDREDDLVCTVSEASQFPEDRMLFTKNKTTVERIENGILVSMEKGRFHWNLKQRSAAWSWERRRRDKHPCPRSTLQKTEEHHASCWKASYQRHQLLQDL